jgi:hypothetical protein
LDQLEIEFEEHELQMISEEGLHHGERLLVKFLIDFDFLIGLTHDSLECKGGELPEGVILIVIADGKVDEVPCDAVEVDVEEVVEELEAVLVDVTLHSFLGQRLCPLQVLN